MLFYNYFKRFCLLNYRTITTQKQGNAIVHYVHNDALSPKIVHTTQIIYSNICTIIYIVDVENTFNNYNAVTVQLFFK